MKFLRSPWVTGLLVVAAIAVVLYQFMGPTFRRFRTNWGGAPPPASNVPAPAAATGKAPGPAPQPQLAVARSHTVLEDPLHPQVPIDVKRAEELYPRWLQSPARDPFILVLATPTVSQVSTNQGQSPIVNWKLNGIWSQTGSRVAAVNGKVYREGEFAEGYLLEKIEADQVWFVISNRLERLRINYLNTNPKSAPPR